MSSTFFWHAISVSAYKRKLWLIHPGPPPHNPYTSYPQNASGFHHAGGAVNNNSCGMPQFPVDLYPAQEVIDKVVKEAISKPWLPLPLGLKPPSTDGVLAELSRQGISSIPPSHQRL
ncbi:two-component response regulator-like APRR2 isoform X2 [Fagus crenata]